MREDRDVDRAGAGLGHELLAVIATTVDGEDAERQQDRTQKGSQGRTSQGHRIPGVINTDSHYNHHGSGWRRNWFACSSDDPGEAYGEILIVRPAVLALGEDVCRTAVPGAL